MRTYGPVAPANIFKEQVGVRLGAKLVGETDDAERVTAATHAMIIRQCVGFVKSVLANFLTRRGAPQRSRTPSGPGLVGGGEGVEGRLPVLTECPQGNPGGQPEPELIRSRALARRTIESVLGGHERSSIQLEGFHRQCRYKNGEREDEHRLGGSMLRRASRRPTRRVGGASAAHGIGVSMGSEGCA